MPKLLVISTSDTAVEPLVTACAISTPDHSVITAHNLMEAYALVEEFEVDFVIVGSEFVGLAEFQMMRILFDALDIQWLILDAQSSAVQGGTGRFRKFDKNDAQKPSEASNFEQIFQQLDHLVRSSKRSARDSQVVRLCDGKSTQKVVLLGASTGGVDALANILADLPSDCPPLVAVQHTGERFGAGLVNFLGRSARARVVRAKNDLVLTRGLVCVAAGQGEHVRLHQSDHTRLQVSSGEPISGHLPSIDALFRSAIPHAPKIVSGLLTGMGNDGAAGLLELRKAGAKTFAQDKASSVIYGMPRVAWLNGGAMRQIALENIAAHILNECRSQEASGETV